MKRDLRAVAELDEDARALVEAARRVARRAHAPYSGFCVGAALRTRAGAVFAACNVENASYGLTICAERNAMCAAVSAGDAEVVAIALYTPTPAPSVPCGACRQFLAEFAPRLPMWIACDSELVRVCSLDELLPDAFSPRELGEAGRADQ